jgi:putative membrane protein
MRSTLTAALIAAAVGASAAQAAAADRPSTNFMHQAARASRAEVELSRLALERSNDPEVRRFADQMVNEHTRSNASLVELARRERVTLPLNMDAAHRAALNRLRRLSGQSFDRAYTSQMARDHEQVVVLFRTQARSRNRDRDVREWADRMLPTLEHHNRMARDLERDERREARR